MLALNTSIVLSKEENKNTLMDMDLLFGDISMMVNQYNQKTILDIIDDGQLSSYENIKPYLYSYNENLDMLFAPKKPEAAEYIGKDSIEKMLKIFQNQYDLIIIDTGINFNECTLYVLDHTETILYVTTGEIVALKNTKLGLGVMKSLGYNNGKVKIVINRFTSGYGIGKAEVEEVFKDNIFAIIPEDKKAVSVSVNKGQPLNDNSRYRRMKIVNAIELMGINLLEKKAT